MPSPARQLESLIPTHEERERGKKLNNFIKRYANTSPSLPEPKNYKFKDGDLIVSRISVGGGNFRSRVGVSPGLRKKQASPSPPPSSSSRSGPPMIDFKKLQPSSLPPGKSQLVSRNASRRPAQPPHSGTSRQPARSSSSGSSSRRGTPPPIQRSRYSVDSNCTTVEPSSERSSVVGGAWDGGGDPRRSRGMQPKHLQILPPKAGSGEGKGRNRTQKL